MALGDSILTGLTGLQFSPTDNPYGLGATVLASSLPKLINPAGSVGTNLGIALGGTLLSALMGYQARQTAADLSSKATDVGLKIMAATTPEERKALADAADEGFYGGQLKSKALDLVTALEGQRKLNELTGEQTYLTELKKLEAQTSPAGKELVKLQTDKLLEGIGARGTQAQELAKLKADLQAENMVLASDIKANEGYLTNDQKIDLKRKEAALAVELLNTNSDPDVIRKNILMQKKAIIDQNKAALDQANRLQLEQFKSALKEVSDSVPEKDQRAAGLAADFMKKAYDLAAYVDQQSSWFETQFKSKYTAADDDVFSQRLADLKASYGNAISGQAISEQEAKRIGAIIEGDWTAGPDTKAKVLRAFADEQAQKQLSILNTFGKNRSQLYEMFSTARQNKSFALPTTVEAPVKPTIPVPASQGMNILSGLTPTPAPGGWTIDDIDRELARRAGQGG